MNSRYNNEDSFLPEPCRNCDFFWSDLKLCTVHRKFSFDDAFKELNKKECYEKIKKFVFTPKSNKGEIV